MRLEELRKTTEGLLSPWSQQRYHYINPLSLQSLIVYAVCIVPDDQLDIQFKTYQDREFVLCFILMVNIYIFVSTSKYLLILYQLTEARATW
jgi:hypothetical protein